MQSTISGVTAAYNREQLWLANENLITKLQACCRGYLVRQEFNSRMNFLKKQVPAITCIQVVISFKCIWNLYSAVVFFVQAYWQLQHTTFFTSFCKLAKGISFSQEFWHIIYFSMSYLVNKVLSGRTGKRRTYLRKLYLSFYCQIQYLGNRATWSVLCMWSVCDEITTVILQELRRNKMVFSFPK